MPSAEELFSSALKQAETPTLLTDPRHPVAPWKPPRGPQGPRKRKPDESWSKLKRVPTSMKKFAPVCKMIRGLMFEKARTQMQLSIKGTAKYVLKALDSAYANANHNHQLDVSRLYVAEAFCSRGPFLKRLRYHAKGRGGMVKRPSCHFFLVLKQAQGEKAPLIGGRGYRQRRAERIALLEQSRLKKVLEAVKNKKAQDEKKQQELKVLKIL